MKNNRNRRNLTGGKSLAIASVIGVAAVAVAVIAAYNTTMSRLVPTSTSTDTTRTFVFGTNEESAEAVSNSVTGIPMEEETEDIPTIALPEATEADTEADDELVEVNKPITADIGNILPVDGEISNPFSNGELVKSATLGVWKTHDGCDILCEIGTDVKSMSEGTVKEITDDPLWGVYVVVEQSNGLEVHYCGLAKELNVKAGQQINQGEIIGKTGDTCQVEILEEPHLHLAVKQSGEWIDPMSVIDGSAE